MLDRNSFLFHLVDAGRSARSFLVLSVMILLIGVGHAAAQSSLSGSVTVTLEQFGLAGHYRPGSIAPVRLQLNYSGQKPVQSALVTIEQPDADGDIQEISQVIALNSGRNFTTLYVPLSYGVGRGTIWDVVVYAYENDRRGQELAAVRIAPKGPAREPETAVFGVVGTRTGNLSSYVPTGNSSRISVTGHEPVQILSDIRTQDLPDRWMGYSLLDLLVWTQGDPIELTIDQADAIKQWVQRGGHFVIVLPQVGDAWQSTRLDAIMPEVVVRRVEGFELIDNDSSGGLLRWISRSETIAPDRREPRFPVFNLHLFEPIGPRWSDSSTIPFMDINWPDLTRNGPSRKAVVVQRSVGLGRVTLVGIPIIDASLNRPGLALPDAEVFWNQILGYRRDLPTPADIDKALRGGSARQFAGSRNRFAAPLSDPIPKLIELSATASRGLLLALVVFIVYWLVSGPGAFAFLRMKNLSRYNWVAFVGIAGVFTGLSWAGASWLRSSEIRPIHVTFLDHVADAALERSTSYFTVALNGYATRKVTLGSAESLDDPAEARRSILRVLSVPGEGVSPFPDVRHYRVNSSNQSGLGIPARSTSKTLYASVLHAPGDGWGMPTFKIDAERPRVDDQGQLQGILVHDLPGTLQDVVVYYVANTLAASRPRSDTQAQGSTRLRIYAVRMSGGRWQAGVPFDLKKIGDVRGYTVQNLATNPTKGQFQRIGTEAAAPHKDFRKSISLSQAWSAFECLTFFRALEPPNWDRSGRSGREEPQFLRPMARETDLSEWLTRPCVIITGFLEGSPLPYPLAIDGVSVSAADPQSVTMVRWVYPLPVDSAPQKWTDPNKPAIENENAPRGDAG